MDLQQTAGFVLSLDYAAEGLEDIALAVRAYVCQTSFTK